MVVRVRLQIILKIPQYIVSGQNIDTDGILSHPSFILHLIPPFTLI